MPRSFAQLLMSSSAAVLAALGLAGSFIPGELLLRLGAAPSAPLMLLVQVLGGLAFGFAMLDWMARHSTLGGIYGRPLVVGNLAHFTIAGVALVKGTLRDPEATMLWPLAAVYALLAVGFAVLLLRAPARAAAAPNTDGR